jgi:RNA polymerase sigma factor (sigma-70 family)
MKKKSKGHKLVEVVKDNLGTPRQIIHDVTEISMAHEDLEILAQKHSQLIDQRNDPVLRKHTVRRQEKLLRKIFKAASQVLTDSQFQIFTMRYVYNMPESEITQQVGCVQNYISRILKASIKKIQKSLRLPINLTGFTKDRKVKEIE